MKKIKLKDYCFIKAAGDKPKEFLEYKTEKYNIPIYANSSENDGLYGYTTKPKILENSVTISARGSCGYIAYRNAPYFPIIRLISLISKDENILDTKYLYYLLKYKTFFSTGSVQKQITIPIVSEYCFGIFEDIEYQKKIANFLWKIDQKIDLNNKINTELESMAKTLYNYWFLQFEFPNEKGKPYKTSGGKMVWNEKLKREIPEGWKIKKFGKISNFLLGGTPSRTEKKYWNGNINWLNSGEISNFPIVTSEEKITKAGLYNSSTKFMKKGTVVVSITGNIRASILAIDSCANQSVVGIEESNTIKKEYIYQHVKMLLTQFTKISTGNCQQHINKKTLEDYYILIPNKNILNEYYKITQNLFSLIFNNTIQNQELISLRDFLLPFLINGQVKI